MGGEFPGHEADFRVRAQAVFQVSVKDAVQDGPVVNRLAGGVFVVGAGGTPFEGGGAVAGVEQIMGAEENGAGGPQPAQFADEFPAVLHVGVIRLVGAEEAPDGTKFAGGFGGVHLDFDRERDGRAGGRVGFTLRG